MANTYPPTVRAKVIAEWKLGASLNKLSQAHSVPKSTVKSWVDAEERTLVAPENARADAREQLGGLVLEYLTVGLGALIAQAREASSPDFIREHGESLYLLHGVIADKITLVLRALELGGKDDPAGLPGGTG